MCFLKKWIQYQLYGDMTMDKYGSFRDIDHCIFIQSI